MWHSSLAGKIYFIVICAVVWTRKFTQSKEDNLQCYCNLAECIPQGYVCKARPTQVHNSSLCFFLLEEKLSVTLQGCPHLLPESRQKKCDHFVGKQAFSQLVSLRMSDSSSPTFTCCQQHMCNHVQYTDDLRGRLEKEISFLKVASNDNSTHLNNKKIYSKHSFQESGHYSSLSMEEIWFKAAVIAVPIIGAMIMCLLILTAVRILRHNFIPLKWTETMNVHNIETDPPPPYPPLLCNNNLIYRHSSLVGLSGNHTETQAASSSSVSIQIPRSPSMNYSHSLPLKNNIANCPAKMDVSFLLTSQQLSSGDNSGENASSSLETNSLENVLHSIPPQRDYCNL